MTASRILVTGGTVLVGPALTGDFIVADVLVENGRIAKIGPALDAPDAQLLDATGTFVLPGFVDVHAHLWEASMRGISADWDIIDFAWGVRYNHVGLHQPDDLYAGAFAGALATLDAGTTTVLDHAHAIASPEHADEALRAVTDAGIRAVWAYGLSAIPGGSDAFTSPVDRQSDARRLRRAVGDLGLVRMALALNDLLSVPWAQTSSEVALARDLDVLLTAHTNTTWGPSRPAEIEYLAHDGLLGGRQVFSHGDASSDHELELLAEAGAALASTPESELQMGLGMPLFARAAALGVRVGLGSDLQANNSPDAFTQMRLARQAENGRRNQAVLDGPGLVGLDGVPVGVRHILHIATMGGAQVLGLDSDIGSLDLGKAADIVLLRNDSIRHRPVIDPFATVVEHSQIGDVDTVLVAGRIVKRGGVLAGSDAATAVTLVEASWSRLARRMADRGGPKPARPDGLFEQLSASVQANLPPWATV